MDWMAGLPRCLVFAALVLVGLWFCTARGGSEWCECERSVGPADAHALCYNFTIDSQPSPGEPWCVVQGQVDAKVFLSYDCGAAKIQSTSPLGEKVKSMNTWEIQTETLRVIGNFLKGQLSDVILEKHMARGVSGPMTLQGRMTCWSEENGHISGSWQFGLNGQICLLFDSENGRWSMDRSGWSHMKEKWENDRAVTNFLKWVSMGHCQAWLQDFMVPWEEMLKSAASPTTATAIDLIWILPVVLTIFSLAVFLVWVLSRNRRCCSQEA